MMQLIEILLEFLESVLCLRIIDIVERYTDQRAEGDELLFLYARFMATAGADQDCGDDVC